MTVYLSKISKKEAMFITKSNEYRFFFRIMDCAPVEHAKYQLHTIIHILRRRMT